jgi:benzoyl-CoA reductase/2-hydroxyglutaryl-CoA dehydratase subunit BcrC/BadD/HgdB
MNQTALPDLFGEIIADPCNPLVERAMDQGRRVIGYTCSYVPEPLLAVAGLQPVRLRAPDPSSTPMADTYLSSVVCPYCRSLLETALDGRYDFVQGWVLTASCDHMRRLYDNLLYLSPPPFAHILDVPHKTGAAALDWFTEELGRLARSLSDHFGVDTGPDALAEAIAQHNAHTGRVRALAALRQRDRPPLTGAAFHQVLVACGMAPKDALAGPLEDLALALDLAEPVSRVRARLLVVGSLLDEPKYLRVLEDLGGLVVADRFCVGSLPGLAPIPTRGDPLRSLAEYSLRQTRCPRMMEDFELRLADILAAARTYRADGVVLQVMKFCDLWGVESMALVDALRPTLPVLRVEREYGFGAEGQLRTRAQAFLETLETLES